MKKRSMDRKLMLAKETIRGLMTTELRFVAGGGGECTERETCGAGSACDCSTSATFTDTCGACSGIQW
jgi:hypothetical protein